MFFEKNFKDENVIVVTLGNKFPKQTQSSSRQGLK